MKQGLSMLFLLVCSHVFGQSKTDCISRQGETIKKIIERTFFGNAESYPTHKSEFIIFDIHLNSGGTVDTIEVIRKHPSIFTARIDSCINKLKQQINQSKCKGYRRILAPVYLFFQDTQGSFNQPFEIVQPKGNHTYVVPTAVVYLQETIN
jgi:ribosome-associated translation inhibitor RaiA